MLYSPDLELAPVFRLDPELVDRAEARGLVRRGQDLADPLAAQIYIPSPVVGLRCHGRADSAGKTL